MNNLNKYKKVFTQVFNINETALNDDLLAEQVSYWDSISHLNLISTLEDEFDIMLDADDILDFRSYKKGIGILKKYNIKF